MVKPGMRTQAVKKVKRRTPGARTVTHFRRGRASRIKCGRCGRGLSGVAYSPAGIRKTPKGSRTPTRPHAGVLCGSCLDALVRYATRMEVKYTNPEYADLDFRRDLTLEKYLPRGWFQQISSGKRWQKSRKKKSFKKTDDSKTKKTVKKSSKKKKK
jgi:ribosomal protein L34E